MKRNFLLLISLVPCLISCNSNSKAPAHSFSVAENKYVYFAESNLQYNPSLKKWKFADNAYDCIDDGNDNIDENYNGYIDLFGWSTPNNPTLCEADNLLYGSGADDATGTNLDYGIYLKDQIGNGYRMFTHDEIHYMLMYRKNAEKLFGYGSIGDRCGLFILPDDFILPNGMTFVPATEDGFTNQYNWYWTNKTKDNYTKNNYTVNDWTTLKASGAVFLPCSGMRYEDETSHINYSGHYWTSSHYGREFANCLCLFQHDLFLEGNFDRCYGLAIRLVKDA